MATQTFHRHPLAVLRTQHNLTQQMLADFAQLSKPTIQRAESGLPIRAQSRQMLCDYFGRSAQELGLLPGPDAPAEPDMLDVGTILNTAVEAGEPLPQKIIVLYVCHHCQQQQRGGSHVWNPARKTVASYS
jgi:transcriptional regulator with XRE-family HTH domain